MSDARFEVHEIEHTADWAIRVRAPDLAGLFAGAATGMFALLTPLVGVAPAATWEFRHDAIDAETLLVDWLNELLFEADRRQIVFARFDIALLQAEPGAPAASLSGVASGGPAKTLSKAIKAVTFSGLHIVHDGAGCTVDIVFDV